MPLYHRPDRDCVVSPELVAQASTVEDKSRLLPFEVPLFGVDTVLRRRSSQWDMSADWERGGDGTVLPGLRDLEGAGTTVPSGRAGG